MNPFERRRQRARQLRTRWPFAAELLAFCEPVFALQAELDARRAEALASSTRGDENAAHAGLDAFTSALVAHVVSAGPPPLAERARELARMTQVEWLALIGPAPSGNQREPGPDDFFRLALAQPWLRIEMERRPSQAPEVGERLTACPRCGGLPCASVLREDVEAATTRRSLCCSTCLAAWTYPRVLCPSCGEEEPAKLPRLSSAEMAWMRIEACDSCGRYLKSVDLTREPAAEPSVDELASTPLDLVARERGYVKVAVNLAGI